MPLPNPRKKPLFTAAPDPIECEELPTSKNCIEWANTGELAIGLDDTIQVAVPNQVHRNNGLRPPEAKPWNRIILYTSEIVSNIELDSNTASLLSYHSLRAQIKTRPVAVSWSPPCLRGGWGALAVLTAQGTVGVWTAVNDMSKGSNWTCRVRLHDVICKVPAGDSEPVIVSADQLLDFTKIAWRTGFDGYDKQGSMMYLSATTTSQHEPLHFGITSEAEPTAHLLSEEESSNLLTQAHPPTYRPIRTVQSSWSHGTNVSIPDQLASHIATLQDLIMEEHGMGSEGKLSETQIWAQDTFTMYPWGPSGESITYEVSLVTAIPLDQANYAQKAKETSFLAFQQSVPPIQKNVNGVASGKVRWPWEYDLNTVSEEEELGMAEEVPCGGQPTAPASNRENGVRPGGGLMTLNYSKYQPYPLGTSDIEKKTLNPSPLVTAALFGNALLLLEAVHEGRLPSQIKTQRTNSLLALVQQTLDFSTHSNLSPPALRSLFSPDEEWLKPARTQLLKSINTYLATVSSLRGSVPQKKGLEKCPVSGCWELSYWLSVREGRCGKGHAMERCQATFLVIPGPWGQKSCERCGNVFLDEFVFGRDGSESDEAGSGGTAGGGEGEGADWMIGFKRSKEEVESENEQVLKRLGDLEYCPYCGGRYIRAL